MSRHVRHRPTMDIFIPVTGGTDPHTLQGMSGYLVDTNADEADIQMRVPKDFGKLQELVVAVIPIVASPSMGFRLLVNHAKVGEVYTIHTRTRDDRAITRAGANVVTEVDIASLVDTASIEAGDYLGIILSRVDAVNATGNMMVMGARLKYQTQ